MKNETRLMHRRDMITAGAHSLQEILSRSCFNAWGISDELKLIMFDVGVQVLDHEKNNMSLSISASITLSPISVSASFIPTTIRGVGSLVRRNRSKERIIDGPVTLRETWLDLTFHASFCSFNRMQPTHHSLSHFNSFHTYVLLLLVKSSKQKAAAQQLQLTSEDRTFSLLRSRLVLKTRQERKDDRLHQSN